MGNRVNKKSFHSLRTDIKNATAKCPRILKLVEERKVNELKSFIAKGGDINKSDTNGLTALHCAVLNGDEEIVELLLAAGSQLKCCRLYYSPIHFAVLTDNANIVRMLINHGDSVNCCDLLGNTPLSLSIEFSHLSITRMLLYKGAYVTSKNLLLSIANGSLEISKLLILTRPSIVSSLSLDKYRFTHRSVSCLKLLAFVGYKFNVEKFLACNRPLNLNEMILGNEIIMPPPHYDHRRDIDSFEEFTQWMKNTVNQPFSLKTLSAIAFYAYCGERSVEKVILELRGLPKLIVSYLMLDSFSSREC